MIRTILKSDNNNLNIELPDDMVGKVIEVIIFSLDEVEYIENGDLEKAERLAAIEKALEKYRINTSGFKFDRDEANDYG
ncbi:hypothetical protein [Mucilaginibacter sp.]|uniref:hypothetical protein n=1 Tax=Mucilaginibacter sp. TaxID=1882438 RepID=UPI00260B2B74|nr:hypothetical protein [Mucilaginibacter sp.]MDB4920486.1 hypothetical protein [Mucilaginibacter sp.]